ncbi:MAG: molecular chaperone HtpG [Pseudobdellovibrio sp.]
MSKTTQSFNAEIKQLLDIVIHSLYSQKEIFLRELISNASDAIDKLKFQSLTNTSVTFNENDLHVRLKPDATNKTLQIIDTGIGMSPEEVTEFIGTIAKSGTKAFSKLNQDMKSKPELIGQFGVGFYSAFMVADRVTLHTQKAGTSVGTIWESTGDGTYTLETAPRAEGHGTTITLHLKAKSTNTQETDEDSTWQDFTDTWLLKSLVKKYSDFVRWPIKMTKEVKTETETKIEDETLNSQKALWLKSTSEISADEYKDFYKHLTHDYQEPSSWIHYKAEGNVEFSTLVYIPKVKPFNYYMKDHEFGLNLYIKRVFIMENCKDLLPPYLRFVKGLVDSSDLSLNVSRELLQQDRFINQIRKNVVSKLLGHFKDMLTKNRDQYLEVWKEFGPTIKEGIPTDPSQIEKLKEIVLFQSTYQDQFTSLEEYVSRMKPEQKDIYFMTGEKIELLKNSPYMEKLKQKNYEVLLLTDAVDEWVTQGITSFKDKKLVSITQEGLDLDSESEKKEKETIRKAQQERFASLIDKMKNFLNSDVKDVVISDRLTDTPVCLVSSQNDMSAQMQKIIAQMGQGHEMNSKRILEINPNHKIFETMLVANDDQQKNWSEILYNQALLTEGSPIPNPAKFSQMVADLMVNSVQK